ncbi:SusC/RagA family TonB-linked outer membrane protein [Chitinophaga parva]|uniref:SusC/RagA family TonB-linked outer membrane protein n=1 Tax=Chitinophaga parva TaxID=2169414 RepID=A0A2T7BPU2_9BACT|nr:TonB-dependent receptor [Chitinophaga parva]PUZ29698.1 SusC/RagA family TonB-linked outer membrane protein [Chitinophaga parva]
MRLTAFFLTALALHVCAKGTSQNISITFRNTPLQQVFQQIKQQTGYVFFYKNQDLTDAKPVNAELHATPLKEALVKVLEGSPLNFDIQGNTIVVSRKPVSILDNHTTAFTLPGDEISGKVVDNKGTPLPGVSVRVKGHTGAAITDAEGHFQLHNVDARATLIVSSIGFESQSVPLAGKVTVEITLRAKVDDLNQYVVVGYGSTKRKDLTGSVASVNPEEVKNVPYASIDQALAGKAAGVQVVQADGSPGGVAKIRIRGGTSLMGGNDPLYIIDGVQVTIQNRYIQNQAEIVNPIERYGNDDPNSAVSGSFSRGLNSLAGLNISDIESIDILKDASATAIYGSKAANGVVIITTKKGKLNQKPVLEANYYAGVSSPVHQKLLGREDYISLLKEAAKNLNEARAAQGLGTSSKADNVLNTPDFLGTANTDWLKLVLRNALSQNADISVRGGGSGSRYYTSLSYTGQKGAVEGTDFSRISGKINLDNEISSKLRIITNLDYGFTKNSITNGVYAAALSAPPTLPAFNPDGSVHQFLASSIGGYDYEGVQNPMALLGGINEGKTASLLGSLSLEYDILKDLKFRSTASVNYNNYHQRNYVPSTAVIASPNGVDDSNGGVGGQAQTEDINSFYENTLTWDKQFSRDHRLNLLVGTSWQKYRYNSFSAQGQGFPDDKFLNNLSSAALTLPSTGISGQNTLLSFYARANYAFKERYLLTFTGRSDASSKFPSKNRVGYFPSGGVAWRMKEEHFMKGVRWINELKLRASAGYTGTQNFGDNLYYTLYTPGSYGRTNALVPTQLGNENIKWENTLQKDLGLDFEMFGSRLRGAIGYYTKNTTGLLLPRSLAPSSSYSNVIANVATINNKGLEIDLRADFIRNRNFQWTGAMNISGNRSKVLDISKDFSDPANPDAFYFGNTVVRKGKPLGMFWGQQFQGIIKDEKTLNDYKSRYTYYQYFEPYMGIGDPMYKLDSTGFAAQGVIGNSEAKFYGGFANTFTYKNFSLIALLTYSYGGQILYLQDVTDMYFTDYTNKGVRIKGRWTPENPGSDRPRLLLGENGYTYTASNNIYSGSYIKLKSVTLTYELPAKVASGLHLRTASAYVSATNLFTITKYPGPDPEVSNNPYSAIDGSSDVSTFPTVKQYNLGIRVGF